jgi:predicted RNase H-like nuclease
VAAILSSGTEAPRLATAASFRDVLKLAPPRSRIAVDMPIGLLDAPAPGGRICDREARRLLGRPRAASVFSPPARPLLSARRFDEVRGQGMTIQGFNIMAKVREVDRAMSVQRQRRVVEAHPELAFRALAGHSMLHGKKSAAGRRERLATLEAGAGTLARSLLALWSASRGTIPGRDATPDDVLDALALAWVALRLACGEAQRVPANPPRDARGLRMEIWF